MDLIKQVQCDIRHQRGLVTVRQGWYDNQRIAIYADEFQGGRAFTATVNMVGEECPADEVWVKDYAGNVGVETWLAEIGVIEGEPTAIASAGHVKVNRFKLTQHVLDIIKKGEGKNG